MPEQKPHQNVTTTGVCVPFVGLNANWVVYNRIGARLDEMREVRYPLSTLFTKVLTDHSQLSIWPSTLCTDAVKKLAAWCFLVL